MSDWRRERQLEPWLDERSARIAARFEIPMLIAALLVIPTIILEDSDVGRTGETIAAVLNWGIWLAFVVEAAVMLAVVPDRKAWARHHPIELIVVVLTPPFLVSALQGIRALRLLRVLRLLRLAPLARRLFSLEGVRFVSLIAAVSLIAGANAFGAVEPDRTVADGFYWAIGCMTTVGFGGPATTGTGKVVAGTLAIVGVGFVAILTGAIAQRFLAPAVTEIERTEEAIESTEERLLAQVSSMTVQLQAMQRELERMRDARRATGERSSGA